MRWMSTSDIWELAGSTAEDAIDELGCEGYCAIDSRGVEHAAWEDGVPCSNCNRDHLEEALDSMLEQKQAYLASLEARERPRASTTTATWRDLMPNVIEVSEFQADGNLRFFASIYANEVSDYLRIRTPAIRWFHASFGEGPDLTGFSIAGPDGPNAIWIRARNLNIGELEKVIAHECKHLQLGTVNGNVSEIAARDFELEYASRKRR